MYIMSSSHPPCIMRGVGWVGESSPLITNLYRCLSIYYGEQCRRELVSVHCSILSSERQCWLIKHPDKRFIDYNAMYLLEGIRDGLILGLVSAIQRSSVIGKELEEYAFSVGQRPRSQWLSGGWYEVGYVYVRFWAPCTRCCARNAYQPVWSYPWATPAGKMEANSGFVPSGR